MPTYVCPTCHKSTSVEDRLEAPFRPFCSERCKLVDLGRWLDGTYRISDPISPADLEEFDGLDAESTVAPSSHPPDEDPASH